ncbi:DUF6216 family protein [Stenotrophomonas sp. S39]|uniref:DUF6216 family protein n=1 Tax=Stenotrophomonas sp. S39 TaxID=2767451 RepID=UPI00190C513F|nr:DUF6216 family protein [Stenotrophomonas sp. S39]MBK0054504.1 hypothetical protein [Stenotrophomonas sp. S39]
MDWISFLTRDVAIGSILGISAAALIICWRVGSFHPVNVRLLRFFIAKDEVEDPIIKKSLADQTALVSFRMTHGVKVRTLRDAQKLSKFSNRTNIPLDLIGRAGWAFNLKSLTLNPNRVPHGAWLALPAFFLLVMILATAGFSAVAASSKLLVSLKATDTWLWLSQDEARVFQPFGQRATINKSSCSNEQDEAEPQVGFHEDDRDILCEIWADPGLEKHFSKELPEQRITFLVAAAIFAWYAFMSFSLLREWIAQRELRDLLDEVVVPDLGSRSKLLERANDD